VTSRTRRSRNQRWPARSGTSAARAAPVFAYFPLAAGVVAAGSVTSAIAGSDPFVLGYVIYGLIAMNASITVSRTDRGSAAAVKAVSAISTGTVQIHPEHPFGTRKPLYWWLLTSQRWTPPRRVRVNLVGDWRVTYGWRCALACQGRVRRWPPGCGGRCQICYSGRRSARPAQGGAAYPAPVLAASGKTQPPPPHDRRQNPDLDGRGVGLHEPVVAADERPGPELLHRRI
jgi:hypothetical protein